jgi:hypothetical protein
MGAPELLVDAMLGLPADDRGAYVGGVLARGRTAELQRLLDDSDRGNSLLDVASDERCTAVRRRARSRQVRGQLRILAVRPRSNTSWAAAVARLRRSRI